LKPKIAKTFACGVQSRANSPDWHVHGLGDLFVAHLLDLAQDEGRAQIGRQKLEELFDHDAVFDSATLVRNDSIKLGRFGSPGSETVHAESDADPVEVAREGAVIPQVSNLSECTNERILSNILGLHRIAKDVGGNANQPCSVSGHERGQGGLVSSPDTLYPPHVFVRGFISLHCHVNSL